MIAFKRMKRIVQKQCSVFLGVMLLMLFCAKNLNAQDVAIDSLKSDVVTTLEVGKTYVIGKQYDMCKVSFTAPADGFLSITPSQKVNNTSLKINGASSTFTKVNGGIEKKGMAKGSVFEGTFYTSGTPSADNTYALVVTFEEGTPYEPLTMTLANPAQGGEWSGAAQYKTYGTKGVPHFEFSSVISADVVATVTIGGNVYSPVKCTVDSYNPKMDVTGMPEIMTEAIAAGLLKAGDSFTLTLSDMVDKEFAANTLNDMTFTYTLASTACTGVTPAASTSRTVLPEEVVFSFDGNVNIDNAKFYFVNKNTGANTELTEAVVEGTSVKITVPALEGLLPKLYNIVAEGVTDESGKVITYGTTEGQLTVSYGTGNGYFKPVMEPANYAEVSSLKTFTATLPGAVVYDESQASSTKMMVSQLEGNSGWVEMENISVSYEINENVITFTLSEEITTPGDYRFEVPGKLFWSKDLYDAGNLSTSTCYYMASQYITCTVLPYGPTTVTPANGSTVNRLNQITLSFDEAVDFDDAAVVTVLKETVIEDDWWGTVQRDTVATVGLEYDYANDKNIIVNLGSIGSAGTYAIVVPEGSIWTEKDKNKKIGEWTYTYIVDGTLSVVVDSLAAFVEKAITWKGELNVNDEMHAQVIATLEQMILAAQAVIDNPESQEAIEQMIADVKAMLDTYMPMIEQYDAKVLATIAIEAAQELMASYTNYTDDAGLANAIATAQTVLADLNMGWSTIDDLNAAVKTLTVVQEAFVVENTPNEWCDIYLDLTNGAFLTTEEMENKSQFSFGVIADSLVRVGVEEKCADIILNGKYHSNEHGWTGFSCTVPVEGPAKIGIGACAWGGDVTVKNADGEVVATFSSNNGTCYHSNKAENIVFAYYTGESTTLTISGGNYVPYISVEKLTEIITEATVTYSLGNVEAEGVLPVSETVIVGKGKITIPVNCTLYAEGKTLTGWTDGVNTYVTGQEIEPAADMLLTPIFTDNQVSLADREQEVPIIWDFRRQNGAPVLSWQGVTGFLIAQAVVNGQTIDVKMEVDATIGKLANGNWQDWCQVNQGTEFRIPACKGATVNLESYSATTTTTIAGDVINQETTTPYYIYNGDADAIDVVIGDGSYFRYIKVVLPVVENDLIGKEFKDEDVSVIWAFTDSITETPSVTPRGVFSEMNASAGSMILGTNSARGVNYITVQPGDATNTIVAWTVTPVHGLTFTPTKVCAKIQRFGTDGGQIDVVVRTNEGTDILATDLIPLRNNKTFEDDKFAGNEKLCDEFHLDVPASLATRKAFTLIAVIKNLGSTKNIGFSDVRIYGTVNGTVSEPINVDGLVSLIAEAVAWKAELNPNDEMHAQVLSTLEQMIPAAQAVADEPESVEQVEQMIFDVNSMLGTYKPMIAKYDAAMVATNAADEAQALYDSYKNPSDNAGFATAILNVREGVELLNDIWEPVSIEELASRVEVMKEAQEAFVAENVKVYTPADVNGDGNISVVDVVAVVNNILGRNAGEFIFEAADMDGNGEISVVDVVAVVNSVLGRNVSVSGARSILRSNLHVTDAEVNAGESTTLYVKLDNAQAYTAMQMDMALPEGLTIEGVEMVGDASHTVTYNEEGRIAAYSLGNSRFHGGEALMAITVKADDSFTGAANVGFTNVRVVSTDVVETVLADALSTVIGGAKGIDGVEADENVQILYYSTTGAVSDAPHKGLNIIKRIWQDGRVEVSKEMKK